MVKRPDSPTYRAAVLPILTGSKACRIQAFYFPVSRDHGPHAAGLEAQQPGDDEAARIVWVRNTARATSCERPSAYPTVKMGANFTANHSSWVLVQGCA